MARSRWTISSGSCGTASALSWSTQVSRPKAAGCATGRLLADVGDLFRHFGVDPSTSPTVVLTHAHYDHAGNLGLFAASEVVMAERELAFWSGPHSQRALFHHSVDDDGLAHLGTIKSEGRMRLFKGTTKIAPGIEVIEVGGHTPGQCMVKVRTSDGTVLLASDAVHYYEEYERDMLFMSVADLVQMYECFDYIRDQVGSGEVHHLVAGARPGDIVAVPSSAGRVLAPGRDDRAARCLTLRARRGLVSQAQLGLRSGDGSYKKAVMGPYLQAR